MKRQAARKLSEQLVTPQGAVNRLRSHHGIRRSTDAIRLYERYGRLPALRVGLNRFRLFDVEDIDRLGAELRAEEAKRSA